MGVCLLLATQKGVPPPPPHTHTHTHKKKNTHTHKKTDRDAYDNGGIRVCLRQAKHPPTESVASGLACWLRVRALDRSIKPRRLFCCRSKSRRERFPEARILLRSLHRGFGHWQLQSGSLKWNLLEGFCSISRLSLGRLVAVS